MSGLAHTETGGGRRDHLGLSSARINLPGVGTASAARRRGMRAAIAERRAAHRPPCTCHPLSGTDFDEVLTRSPQGAQRLAEQYLRAQHVLWANGLAFALALIDSTIVNAAKLVRAGEPAGAGSTDPVTKALADGADAATQHIDRVESENARRRYCQGLLAGVAASLLLLVVIALTSTIVIKHFMSWRSGTQPRTLPASDYFALRDVLVCVGGGAAGAAVSVLLRVRRERDLRYDTVSNGAAFYRVALGWFFAAAALFLVKGTLTNVFTDPSAKLASSTGASGTAGDTVSSWFFWGGVGFLAGFNERWATNLISRQPRDGDAGVSNAPARPANAASPVPPASATEAA